MADILQFSGMLQSTTSSFLRRPDQLILSINVNGDEPGVVGERLGYTQYGDTLEVDEDVNGLFSYNDVSGGTHNLFAYINGKIKYNNAGVWTNVQTGLLADAKVEGRVFLDKLFVCGANSSNSYIATANIDATTYSTTSNLTNAPRAKYIEVFKDQIYLADVQVSGVRYPDRFYRSSIPSSIPSSGAITWDTDNYEQVYTNNGEAIMGLHANKSLNQLLFFKENSMHAWDTLRLRDVGNVGTSAHRSIATINYTTFFFNEKGIYTYTGSEPQRISRPIQKWIKAISDPTAVFAMADDEFYKLYIGNVTVDGVSYTNCEIRYSYQDNTFTIYSYYDSFTAYASHKVSNVVRPYAGAADGEVHQLAIDGDEVYSDDGAAINYEFMFETDMGLPSERKSIDRAIIYTTNAQTLTGRLRVRNKDWSTHFSVNRDEQERNLNCRDGRFLQFHFSGSSTTAPMKFEGLTFSPQLTTKKYVRL